jgi:ankyrin repeat domain-containing protein 50
VHLIICVTGYHPININLGKERSAFLEWVSNIDFERVHEDMYARKYERTCDWLIDEPKYQQWLSSSTSSLLWCYGKRK